LDAPPSLSIQKYLILSASKIVADLTMQGRIVCTDMRRLVMEWAYLTFFVNVVCMVKNAVRAILPAIDAHGNQALGQHLKLTKEKSVLSFQKSATQPTRRISTKPLRSPVGRNRQ
jgi:hypothetical protein